MSCYNTIPRSLRLRLQESLIDAISNTLLEEFNNLKIVDNIFNISDDLFNKVKNIIFNVSYRNSSKNKSTIQIDM